MDQTLDDHIDTSWQEQFASECERIIEALGMIADGGIIEQIEHVGATSVPGMSGQPYIDIALAVWPFPLEESARQAIESLDYQLDPDFSGAPEQRFRHTSGPFHLYVAEAGSALWADFVLVRDYLRHDEAARLALATHKREWSGSTDSPRYRQAKKQWLDHLVGDAHQSWIEREQFAPLQRVAEELRGLPCPWYICGGWALDVFQGNVTRVHHDVDVLVPRADQLILREHMITRGWRLLTPLDGRYEPWPAHMRLEPPRHQAHAFRGGSFIDFLLTDLDGIWRYRREPTIIREMSRMSLRSADGIPFLAPELVLLFKSTTTSGRERGKDQTDFEAMYSALEPERRAWLRWALTAVDPSHRWIELL